MNHSFEPVAENAFAEFVELFNQITATPKVEAKVEEKISNDKISPKIDLSPMTGKITALRVSKSLIRQLIYKGEPYPVCPYKVYHTTLLRDIITPPSDSMVKGLYFESKCLGSSADGSAIIDKNKTQVYHKQRWIDPGHNCNIPVYIDGTLDLISQITTPGYSFTSATIDLKLTKDKDVCDSFSNGLFHATPWGNMEMADFTEAMMYRLIFGKPFVYLVFDYKSANAGFKEIPVITDTNDPDPKNAAKAVVRMADLRRTISWPVNAILGWESLGWPMTPIAKVCASCSILDCQKRNESNEA